MSEFVEFEISGVEAFRGLESVASALVTAKRNGDWKDDEFWLSYFDQAARAHFWWPSPEELKMWEKRWFSTPVDRRFNDPSLVTPWGFGSMIDAFKNGDYDLVGCRRISEAIGRFEFVSHGWPYGGTSCMKQLIEAFGHRVTSEPDV